MSISFNKQAKYNKKPMGIKKIINKLNKCPKEMRIDELKTLFQYFGYELDRIKGSHFIFTKTNTRGIIIPVHNNKVHRIYLKKIKKILMNYS